MPISAHWQMVRAFFKVLRALLNRAPSRQMWVAAGLSLVVNGLVLFLLWFAFLPQAIEVFIPIRTINIVMVEASPPKDDPVPTAEEPQSDEIPADAGVKDLLAVLSADSQSGQKDRETEQAFARFLQDATCLDRVGGDDEERPFGCGAAQTRSEDDPERRERAHMISAKFLELASEGFETDAAGEALPEPTEKENLAKQGAYRNDGDDAFGKWPWER